MRLLEREFQARAPLERVWDHLAAIDRWPSWARHIRRVEVAPSGPLSHATTGTIVLTNGIRSTFRMTALEPGVHWLWSGPFLWLSVDYDHRLERVDDDLTTVRFTVDVSGFGTAVLGRLFAAIYARNLDRAIPRLIEELEAGSSGPRG